MRDVMTELEAWWRAGESVGVGTVVGTWKSSPRQPGASMLVGPDGTVVGSVSGGCVEGAVYELASTVRDSPLGRQSDASPVLQRYGISDDDAFSVGLTCGGIIDVFVEAISRETFPQFGSLAASILSGEPVALATVTSGRPDQLGRHLLIWTDDWAGGARGDPPGG